MPSMKLSILTCLSVLLLLGSLIACDGSKPSRSRDSWRFSADKRDGVEMDTSFTPESTRKEQVVESGSSQGSSLGIHHRTSKSTRFSCKDGGKSGKGKGGKAGKGYNCATYPWSAPSFSARPSSIQTLALQPSTFPSLRQSMTPSGTPTNEPSVSQSEFPTMKPSIIPSFPLTFLPSSSPIFQPTDSTSIHTSTSPSPTRNPVPTREPSTLSTNTFPPTVRRFSLEPAGTSYTTTDNPEGLESTCDYSLPNDMAGILKPQRLVFLYYMYVPEGSEEDVVQDKIRDIEDQIHRGLSVEFLKCDTEARLENSSIAAFDIWSVSSRPPDERYSDECDLDESNATSATPQGSDCIAIVAYLGMIVFFPASRQIDSENALQSVTDADDQVLDAAGDYLYSLMEDGGLNDDVVQHTQFKGFIMPEDPSKGPNVTAANQQVQTRQEKSRIRAGATAMALACLCLLAVVLFTIRRRKRRSELYLQHLEGMPASSDKDSSSLDPTTYIVEEGSFDWTDSHGESNFVNGKDMPQDRENLDNYQHDVHKCSSAYCSVCRPLESATPMFLPTDEVSPHVQGILDDLRCSPSITDDSRSYNTPDTVDL